MKKILIAPNAFKGSLDANQVAQLIKQGLEKSRNLFEYLEAPIADGGDGTLDVLVTALSGQINSFRVEDPLGRLVSCPIGVVNGGDTAIIEMAHASGIKYLNENELSPMLASSVGTGQAITKAIDLGCQEIVLTLGGSATVDGGVGLLSALGVKFWDLKGESITKLNGVALETINDIDLSRLTELRDLKFTILCDVDNPLLGKQGAASVFGPQKGATPEMVEKLESGLSNLARLIFEKRKIDITRISGGGAAGGIAAMLMGTLKVEKVGGSEYVLDKIGFFDKLNQSDVLITAEGRIDEQTRFGKGPYEVAKYAKERGMKVIALAGQVDSELNTNHFEFFDVILPIGSGPMTLEKAINLSRQNLVRTCQQVGNLLDKI